MDTTSQKEFTAIKADYRFTKDDEAVLLQMKPELESVAGLHFFFQHWQNITLDEFDTFSYLS